MSINKTPKGNHKVDTEELVKLHGQTAKLLSTLLKEDGVDAKVLELAIKFLDNNGITAIPTLEDPNKLGAEQLPKVREDLDRLTKQFEFEDSLTEDFIADAG